MFSSHPNGFGISPYLREKLVFLGQFEVYKQASDLAQTMLGVTIGPSQIDRLTSHYGAAIDAHLDQPAPAQETATEPLGVIYAQADGAMLLTEEGYKEAKLGRIFAETALKESVVEGRGGQIESSVLVAHLGTAADFSSKLTAQLAPYKARGQNLVFISDGSIWLRQMMEKSYPEATLILDMYHVLAHIGEVGKAALGTGKASSEWFKVQRKLLLDSFLNEVLVNIRALKVAPALQDSVCSYLVLLKS